MVINIIKNKKKFKFCGCLRGFSMIEVIVSVLILGVLANGFYAFYTDSDVISVDRGVWRDLENLVIAARQYKQDHGILPPNYDALMTGGYIGEFFPEKFSYGYIYSNTNQGYVFAGTNSLDAATAQKDHENKQFLIIVK